MLAVFHKFGESGLPIQKGGRFPMRSHTPSLQSGLQNMAECVL